MKSSPEIGETPCLDDSISLQEFFMKKKITAGQATEIFSEDIVLKFRESTRVEWFSYFKICRLPASKRGLEQFARLVKSKVFALLYDNYCASFPFCLDLVGII